LQSRWCPALRWREPGLRLLHGTADSGKMRKPDDLAKAIRIAAVRVQGAGGVLVLRDGDDADVDCPVQLAEMLRPDQNLVPVGVEMVVACQEYESWFLAAADSLRAHPDVRNDAVAPANPEGRRDAKRELEKLMLESYKETRQPGLPGCRSGWRGSTGPGVSFLSRRCWAGWSVGCEPGEPVDGGGDDRGPGPAGGEAEAVAAAAASLAIFRPASRSSSRSARSRPLVTPAAVVRLPSSTTRAARSTRAPVASRSSWAS
jgi:hypothetical protein